MECTNFEYILAIFSSPLLYTPFISLQPNIGPESVYAGKDIYLSLLEYYRLHLKFEGDATP